MTTETDFVPGSLRGKFVEHASREIGGRRWDEARQRHGLSLVSDVPEHPRNCSEAHYAISRRLERLAVGMAEEPTVPEEPSRWYPVATSILESYGDLSFRIRLLFALPGMAIEGTFEDARRGVKNKQKGALLRSRLVNFHAADGGTRVERYSATGRKERLAITHEVLGYELTRGFNAEALWCPEGLNQARTILGEINGSAELLGTGLPPAGVHLINEAEYQALVSREFDRGERG